MHVVTSLHCENSLSQWLLVGGMTTTIGLYRGVSCSGIGRDCSSAAAKSSASLRARVRARELRDGRVGLEAAASSSNGLRACNSSGVKSASVPRET
ncbi:hypothetical protein PC123_g20380 [Phytophthora cactorum]|nr:hypothetical protein PC123_g20380 [Phytophthora cactorum]